jgi:hypothetical protein
LFANFERRKTVGKVIRKKLAGELIYKFVLSNRSLFDLEKEQNCIFGTTKEAQVKVDFRIKKISATVKKIIDFLRKHVAEIDMQSHHSAKEQLFQFFTVESLQKKCT